MERSINLTWPQDIAMHGDTFCPISWKQGQRLFVLMMLLVNDLSLEVGDIPDRHG